jgi:Flp pilus assembly protein CpaB
VVVVGAALVMVAAGTQARVRAAEQRWGGAPVSVLVATSDLPVGATTHGLRGVELPPRAVPPHAVTAAQGETLEAVLALALPEGGVLTRAHLDPRGPAAGLGGDLRAVPIPVDDGWGVAAGGWVDVWVLGTAETPATLVAGSRPVLEVRGEASERTALVGLHAGEVGAATAGLAVGQVLLTHAPPPG